MNTKHVIFRNLFAATVTLMLTVAAAQAQSAFTNALMNLSPGPVAYWPLQETVQPPAPYVETNLGSLGSIANAYYASTNVVGQYEGGLPFSGIPGDSGNVGVYFEGNPAAFMAVPTTSSSVSLQAGHAFSVEAWIFPNNYAQIAGLVSQTGPAVYGGLNEANNSAGWSLNLNYLPRLATNILSTNSMIGFSFHVFNGIGSGGAEADAGNWFSSNTWYHLVGVFDGTNCTLYVDGTNGTSLQTPIAGSFVPDTWDPIMFGVSHALDAGGAGTAYPPYAYKGGMADVAIYTNALSAAQVANDYSYGENSGYTNYIFNNNHPYMFWQMGAPQYTVPPTNAYPTAGNLGSDNDPGIVGLYQPGTLPGSPGPQYSGMGAATNACALNGLNSGVMVWTNDNSLSSPLNVTNTSTTLLCWFKGNPADAENRYQGIVSRGNNGWRLSLDETGHVHWTFATGSDLVSAWPYNDGNWHFIAGVYSNTGTVGPGGFGWTATNYLYVDGRLDNSALVTNNETAAITNLGLIIGGDANFIVTNLGAVSPGYYSGQRYFAGSLAHVAFFTNALTGSQILNLYTNAVVNQAPYIVGQPTTGRSVLGGTGTYVFFGVVANGSPTLGYQWYFNSTSNYSGATLLNNDNVNYFNEQTVNMTVSNLVNSESGYYYVVVNNGFGSATSALASLTVTASPVITSQTPSGPFTLYTNQTATLSVTANGPATLAYQWFTNGVADTTAGTTSTYLAVGPQAASGETYYCQVSDSYGTTNSATDTLTLLSLPPNIVNSPYGSNVIAMGASGYWPMHEKETQPLVGDVETNYGTYGAMGDGYYQDWAQPTVTHDSQGAIAGSTDGAVTFYNQNNDALIVPHNSPELTIGANQSQFALESWVKPMADNVGGIGSYMVIMGEGAVGNNSIDGSSSQAGFALQYGGTASTFSMVVQDGAGSSNFEQKTYANFPPGQWYHLVCFWNGSNYNLYINGQNQNLQNPNGNEVNNPMNPDICAPISIGGGRWGTGGMSHPFIGSIDEVAIYTNITTANQAQSLASIDYAAGTSSSSNYFQTVVNNQPLLYYRMDAPSYTEPPYSAMTAVLTNYGSVALNGVYTPSAIPGSAMGPISAGGTLSRSLSGTNAMAGNGVEAFADGGIAPQFDPVTTNAFSYSLWARGYPVDERSYNEMFCGNDSTWRSCINSSGKFQIHGNADIIPAQVVNDGNWHHWVITAQPGITNGVWTGNFTNTVYIDGALAIQSINTGTNNPTGNPGPEVTIGTEWGKTNCVSDANGGRQFAGDVCEAAFFFGTVLTPSQVQSIYNSADMAPSIVTQPVSGTGIVTQGYTNSVTANGAQPLYFQWYTNGVAIGTVTNISGQNTNGVLSPISTEQLVINPVQAVDAATYYVVITNAYGSITSSIATLAEISAPVITNSTPTTYTNLFTVYAGVSPTFTVQASGAPPLGYYWYTNGVIDKAAGSTSPSFTFSNLQSVLTNYCIVSNFVGTVKSTVWTAQVVPDPTAAYPLAVIADNPVAYWPLDDTNLDGFDNGSGDSGYIANDYINGNNGTYTNMDLANAYGISSYNPLTDPNAFGADFDYVGTPSDVNSIMQPDMATPNGQNAEFTVSAWVYPNAAEPGNAGMVTKGLFYQEEFNLDNGGTSGTNTGTFRFECRNAAGTDSSSSAPISTQHSGVPNQWYHLVGVCDEANGLVSIYVNGQLGGTAPIAALSGITNSSQTPISIGSRSSLDPTYFFGDQNQQFLGYISDVAIFKYAMTPSQIANLYTTSGNVSPFFVANPPAGITNSAGTALVVTNAIAAGSGPLTYWWNLMTNGTEISNVISGTTAASIVTPNLTVPSLPAIWNGDQLELVVSNAYGGTNVSVALSVVTGLSVAVSGAPTTNTFLYDGYTMTYTATALGSHPFYYQWYTNNVAVPNATGASFTLAAQLGLTNAVSLVASNNYNGYTATNIVVDWLAAVALPSDPYGQEMLSLGPLAYWRLTEPGGSPIAYDYVGGYNGLYGVNTTNGLPGVSTAYPGFGIQGDLGVFMCNTPPSGYVTNGCVCVPNGVNLNTNAVTFVSWVYLPVAQNNPSGIIFSRAQNANGDQIGGADDLDYTFDGLASTYDYGSGMVVPLNTWTMVALAINPNNAMLYVFNSAGPQSAENNVANVVESFAGGPLNLGADENGPTSITRILNGEMDEAAIFPYTLTESQLQQLYTVAQTPSVNTSPTEITFSVAHNQLTLSWPSDHIGWQLQVQTNKLSVGINANWVNVAGSTGTDQEVFPLSVTNGCVFYRLVYP